MEKYTWQFISKAAEPMLHRILWDTPEDVPPGSVLGPEVRNMYLIECNVSGYGRVIVNGKEFKVSPRRAYILRPGDEVTMIADEVEPRQALWCMFGGAKVGEISLTLPNSKKSFFSAKNVGGKLALLPIFARKIQIDSVFADNISDISFDYFYIGSLTDIK